jgi:hypothetical protein
MPSLPQTYTISDFIEWSRKGQLRLDPDFQRGSVWTPAARVFLIDTILNDLPIPQIYFRSTVDANTQTTVREVVDGQQRLRAILDFASGKLRLTSKAPKYRGKLYDNLDLEDKETFLNYKVAVVQLLNATNADVLEVFARLNSYSVKVTPAELRHAEYSEPVKWAIYDATRQWPALWDEYKIVSVRDSVRLKNTSTIAELFIILDTGYGDGGEATITKYYKSRKRQEEFFFKPLRESLDEILNEIIENMGDGFRETTFFDAPNFLALFAAVAWLKGHSPASRTTENVSNLRGGGIDWQRGTEKLAEIAQAFDNYDPESDSDNPFSSFVALSKSTTHRVASRKPRFETIVRALQNNAS